MDCWSILDKILRDPRQQSYGLVINSGQIPQDPSQDPIESWSILDKILWDPVRDSAGLNRILWNIKQDDELLCTCS